MSSIQPMFSGHTLSSGTVLHDNYIINSVLGEGGFGITYSGTCVSTKEQVAIKEFFPSGVATRTMQNDKLCVSHFEGKLADSFQRGMHRFLNEANLLKEFHSLSSIVSVFDVFEENDTAYIVMEYIEGITLKQLILNEGALPFDEMLTLFKPVLLDLHEVHKRGLIHRDISPDNLIVGMDNHLHLIDFGAASFKNPNESKTITVILKSGYAPPEQYISDGRIGAWTDVYGLCATMYMVLNGEKPIDAIRRMQNDSLDFVDGHSPLADYQKNAILQGLRLNYAERFSSAKLLYQALTAVPTEEITETIESAAMSTRIKEQIKEISEPTSAPETKKSIFFPQKGFIYTILLTIIFVGIWSITRMDTDKLENVKSPSTEQSIRNTTVEERTSTETSTETKVSSSLDDSSEIETTILTMIDVTNKAAEDAKSELKALDSSIEVTITEEYNSEIATGHVISQSIAKGTQFTKGHITQIQLVVSKGPMPTTQAPKSTSGNTSNNNNNSTSKKKDDGYSTIHLD